MNWFILMETKKSLNLPSASCRLKKASCVVSLSPKI